MSQNKDVIMGEASESEDEKDNIDDNMKRFGIAIEGEAPESDEEIISYTKSPSKDGVESYSRNYESPRKRSINDSILQKKLNETNISLWKNLTTLIQTTALVASKQLLSADQLLLKSQVTLQSVSYNLKTANTATKQILDKTNMITANFIPSISI